MVFVIGLGRSGTHLMANILNSHPDIHCDIEMQPQFNMAVNIVVKKSPIRSLVNLYKKRKDSIENRIYATKDYTNIWLVEKLRCLNPKFVCIERDPYQVISSSLQHKGVLNWVENENHPPNPLSGNYIEEWGSMSIIERLALRWVIHKQRATQLKKNNKADIQFFGFSDLIVYPDENLLQLQRFVGVRKAFDNIPELDKRPLNKYMDYLSGSDRVRIRQILNKYENIPCLPR